MSDLISVIVPIYNTGLYLKRCIDSILAQNYPNFEIILVNDGSTDRDTIKLCNNYNTQYKNIVLIQKENGGASSARIAGIQNAQGEYVCFIDSDDYIEYNMLSDLYSLIKKYQTKVILSELTYDNYKTISRPDSIPQEGAYDKIRILHYFLLGYWHSACTAMYNRTIFEHNLFPIGETNEDYIFNFHVICSVDKIAVSSKSYYHYVLQNNSVTQTNCNLKNLDWLKHTQYILNKIQSSPDLYKLREEAYYQYLVSNIILCNKALLSMDKGFYTDSNIVYHVAADNLKTCKRWIAKNTFLNFRYRTMAYIIAFSPLVYRKVILLLLNLKKRI